MERSGKRGKIPQQDWPAIIKRYEAGETLASIARTYDCSPPAISYIVSRTRARDAAGEGTVEVSEPRLIKGNANETPPSKASQEEAAAGAVLGGRAEAGELRPVAPLPGEVPSTELALIEPAPALDPRKEISSGPSDSAAEQLKPPNADGSGALNSTDVSQNGGHQRTLRLSSPPGGAPRSNGQNRDVPHSEVTGSDENPTVAASAAQQLELAQPSRQAPASAPFAPAGINGPVRKMTEPQRMRDGGAFIDQALRERVDGDITAFLAAFDAALAQDSPENRAGLREATDRLLRAGARTRIELERLEARLPLPARDTAANAPIAWRPR